MVQSVAYTFIFAEVPFPQGGYLNIGKVPRQEIYCNRKFICSHNENLLLNTIAYSVEL